jgi:DNA-directed RNA polymerase subunit RPC12/RpoP
MTRPDYLVKCPRCGFRSYTPLGVPVPDPAAPYPALSRQEDTYICAACGQEEALLDFAGAPAWEPEAWRAREGSAS